MPKKPINLRIDGQLLERLKNLAEESRTSLTHIIESFCQYGLQQDIEISKDGVSINVNTIDEDQLQQKIQEVVDTTVEAKVKTILADINTNVDTKVKAVEERLASLEQKTSHLTEAEFEWLKRSIELKRQQKLQQRQKEEQSKENGLQRTVGLPKDVSPQQVEQERLQSEYGGGNGSQQPKETGKAVSPQQEKRLAAENRGQLNNLSSDRLRELCTEYGIKWSHAYGRNKHLKKAEMVEAILNR